MEDLFFMIAVNAPACLLRSISPLAPFPGREHLPLFLLDGDTKITYLRALHDGVGAD
jgi:hypothetical protein